MQINLLKIILYDTFMMGTGYRLKPKNNMVETNG